MLVELPGVNGCYFDLIFVPLLHPRIEGLHFEELKKKQDWSDVSYRHGCFPSIHKYADFPIYLSIYLSISLSLSNLSRSLSLTSTSIRALLFCLYRFEFVFCCTSGEGKRFLGCHSYLKVIFFYRVS